MQSPIMHLCTPIHSHQPGCVALAPLLLSHCLSCMTLRLQSFCLHARRGRLFLCSLFFDVFSRQPNHDSADPPSLRLQYNDRAGCAGWIDAVSTYQQGTEQLCARCRLKGAVAPTADSLAYYSISCVEPRGLSSLTEKMQNDLANAK